MSRGTATPKQIVVGICLLALVGGVLLVGFVSTDDTDDTTPDRIGENAAERYAAIAGLNATRTTVIRDGNETVRSVHRVSVRPNEGWFRERLVTGDDRYNNLTVSNGSVMWWRNQATGNVTRLDLSDTDLPEERTQGDRIEELFERLNVTEATTSTAATATPGIDPLPSVPQSGGGQGGETTDAIEDAAFGVSYNGTETVDGRTVYVLHVQPDNESLVDEYEQTLWVDAEYFFPLRRHTEWKTDGERRSRTVTYENVSFDPDLDDAVFEYAPPAEAPVERKDQPRIDTYSSTTALRAETNVSVPEPTLPPTFTLEYATEMDSRGIRNVALRYANATARITVTKSTRGGSSDGDWRVTVAEQPADVRVGYTNYVTWSCGGYYYKVFSDEIGPGTLIDVARSVGCE
jgi:outer membrane lipoprotein-sorting protein